MAGLKKVNQFAQHITGVKRTNQILGDITGLHGAPDAQPPVAASPTPGPSPLPDVPPMPTPDDQAVKLAKRRSIAAQRARHGRVSTIFTDPNIGTGLGG